MLVNRFHHSIDYEGFVVTKEALRRYFIYSVDILIRISVCLLIEPIIHP